MPPRGKKDKGSAYFRQNVPKGKPKGRKPTLGELKEVCPLCGKEVIFEEAEMLADGTLICVECKQRRDSTNARLRLADPGDWADLLDP